MRPPSMRDDEKESALSRWAGWLCKENEIRKCVHPLLSPAQPKLGNPGLVFAKFAGTLALYEHRRAVDQWEKRDRRGRSPEIKNQKAPVLHAIAAGYAQWQGSEKMLLELLAQRSSAGANSFVKDRPGAELVEVAARLTWRMTSRLGEAHAFENGFMFHPLFGVPYLPGSGFKGAVRFAYWARWIAELPESHDRSRSEAIMQLLFGSTDPAIGEKDRNEEHERGAAVFFDVFPQHDARLEVDILNPHFPKWYQERALESDDQNPVPNVFLTVSAKSAWHFFVALLPRAERQVSAGDVAQAKELLRIAIDDALQLWGLGAKTAAGYGVFDLTDAAAGGEREDRQRTAAPAKSSPQATAANYIAAAPTFADPFLVRLRTFKASDYGQLSQLVKKIESRSDRYPCLQLLGTRLLELYGRDKKQLKTLREKYPALAPYLVK